MPRQSLASELRVLVQFEQMFGQGLSSRHFCHLRFTDLLEDRHGATSIHSRTRGPVATLRTRWSGEVENMPCECDSGSRYEVVCGSRGSALLSWGTAGTATPLCDGRGLQVASRSTAHATSTLYCRVFEAVDFAAIFGKHAATSGAATGAVPSPS